MPDGFTFADDDKKSAAAPSKAAFSWDDDKTAPSEATARVAQPTEFEKARTPQEGFIRGGLNELWDQAKGAAKSLYPNRENWYGTAGPGGVLSPVKNSLDAVQNWARRTDEGRSTGYKALTGATEMAGLPTGAQGEEEAAKHGDVGGVLGHAAVPMVEAAGAYGASELAPRIAARMPNVGTVATAPVRFASRAAEHAVNEIPGVSSVRAAKGLMQPADEAVNMRIKIPGRDFGLPAVEAEKPFVPQGPKLPAELAGPGGIPVVGSEPLRLTSPETGRETAIQQSFFPKVEGAAQGVPAPQPYSAGMPAVREPGRVGPPLQRLEELIQQASGTPPGGMPGLEPGVSLRNQSPQSLGAASEGFAPAVDPTKNVPLREQRQLQKPFGNRAAVEVSEMHGPRTVAPEQIPQVIQNTVDQAMGAELTPEASEKARLQAKYPDSGDRQAIHRTSEKVFEATRDNPKLRKALGDLPAHDNKGGPDLARAAANLGEDLGERRIGNKKAEWMGAGQIGRGEMFDRLLDKGYTAQEIFDAAHAEPKAGKPGMMRATGERPAREKTGD